MTPHYHLYGLVLRQHLHSSLRQISYTFEFLIPIKNTHQTTPKGKHFAKHMLLHLIPYSCASHSPKGSQGATIVRTSSIG